MTIMTTKPPPEPKWWILYVGVGVVAFAAWVIMSAFEASVYSDITGRDVSTFQAMFVELRVDCS